uniref:Large conductance mechanosensitive channel protein n=1 Tax=viral metagenome TaxID=1070528 RepID=A0A6C0EDT1_9ZZZZ
MDFINNALVSLRSLLNFIINEVQIVIIAILQFIINFSADNLKSFIQFIFDKNIIQMCIGIIVATQIGTLSNVFNDIIIKPILEKSSIVNNEKIENIKYSLLGIEFRIGTLLITIIKLLVTFMIVFIIYKISTDVNIGNFFKKLSQIKL